VTGFWIMVGLVFLAMCLWEASGKIADAIYRAGKGGPR